MQTMQKEVKCQRSVLTARKQQTIRGTPYSCLAFWKQSFDKIDADGVNCVTANILHENTELLLFSHKMFFHIFPFYQNQQLFHIKLVNVLLKLTACFMQS